MKTITMTRSGAIKTIPVGFSWTTMFFSFWPSLFRQQWNAFGACLCSDILASILIVVIPENFIWIMLCWIAARAAVAEMRNRDYRILLERDGWELAINNSNTKIHAAVFSAND